MPPSGPDLGSLYCAPAGMWRVVECVQHSAAQANQLMEAMEAGAMTESDLRWAYIGPFSRLIGDYASFPEASRTVDYVQFPYERRLFNDRGVEVVAHRPGRSDAPDAGGES